MSRRLWDTEVPWPEPMNETEAAQALTEWEERIRVERDGRDLPPEPDDEHPEDRQASQEAVQRAETEWVDSDPACPNCEAQTGFTAVYGEMLRCRMCGAAVSEQEVQRFNAGRRL